MKLRSLALVATALVLPFAATACGDDSTGDLDKGDLVDEFKDSGMDDAQADCMAGAIIDSDFTKDELDEMNADPTKLEDTDKGKEYMAAVTTCVTGDVTGS